MKKTRLRGTFTSKASLGKNDEARRKAGLRNLRRLADDTPEQGSPGEQRRQGVSTAAVHAFSPGEFAVLLQKCRLSSALSVLELTGAGTDSGTLLGRLYHTTRVRERILRPRPVPTATVGTAHRTQRR